MDMDGRIKFTSAVMCRVLAQQGKSADEIESFMQGDVAALRCRRRISLDGY
jgi:hypothetical protein